MTFMLINDNDKANRPSQRSQVVKVTDLIPTEARLWPSADMFPR